MVLVPKTISYSTACKSGCHPGGILPIIQSDPTVAMKLSSFTSPCNLLDRNNSNGFDEFCSVIGAYDGGTSS